MSGLTLKQAIAIGVMVAAGLAGAVTTLTTRNGDDPFLFRQRNPSELRAPAVERVVRRAGEPVQGKHPPGVAARCTPGGHGELKNPWRCRVRYRSGFTAVFKVTVGDDGSFYGAYHGVEGVAQGCCIEVPSGG